MENWVILSAAKILSEFYLITSIKKIIAGKDFFTKFWVIRLNFGIIKDNCILFFLRNVDAFSYWLHIDSRHLFLWGICRLVSRSTHFDQYIFLNAICLFEVVLWDASFLSFCLSIMLWNIFMPNRNRVLRLTKMDQRRSLTICY